MDSTGTSSSLSSVKSILKDWERRFKAIEGRLPTKSDIKRDPEIAKLYSTYHQSAKRNPQPNTKPDHPSSTANHRSSSSSSSTSPSPSPSSFQHPHLNHHQVFSTPSKTNNHQNSSSHHQQSHHPKPNPAHPPSPLKSITNLGPVSTNSPRRIKKIVQHISSPKRTIHHHQEDRSNRSQKLPPNPTTINNRTPKQFSKHQSPFDLDSGGGIGSPNLFADLLLESNKQTPRTKARKFLMGIGSPLKPRLNGSQLSLATQTTTTGLSSFLKPQSIISTDRNLTETSTSTSSNLLNDLQDQQLDAQDDDDDADADEILGPSPFKPKSDTQVFQPLFDDPEPDPDLHSSQLSPTKSIKPKWKINSTITPFVSSSSSSSSQQVNNPSAPDCGQKQSSLRDRTKKKNTGSGAKRKRLVQPGQEDPSFYEDLPDPTSDHHQSSLILTNHKKKRTEALSSNHAVQQNNLQKRSNHETKDSSAQSLPAVKRRQGNKATQVIGSSSRLSIDPLSSDPSREHSEERSKQNLAIPNLPFGNPDQSAVYTELEIFRFTRSSKPNHDKVETISQTKKGKGKAKEVNDEDDDDSQVNLVAKPIKFGTRKVLVRAYRPMKDINIIGQTIDDLADGLINPELSECEIEESINLDEIEREEEEEEEEGVDDEEEIEGDVQVSEELMRVLKIEDYLMNQDEDRKRLIRERKRELNVRRILDGMTMMEKTLVSPQEPKTKKVTSKSMYNNQDNKKKKKGDLNQNIQNLKRIIKPNQDQDQSIKKDDALIESEDLRLELTIDELKNEEIFQSQVIDQDEDWEDEPLGWKLEDQFIFD